MIHHVGPTDEDLPARNWILTWICHVHRIACKGHVWRNASLPAHLHAAVGSCYPDVPTRFPRANARCSSLVGCIRQHRYLPAVLGLNVSNYPSHFGTSAIGSNMPAMSFRSPCLEKSNITVDIMLYMHSIATRNMESLRGMCG